MGSPWWDRKASDQRTQWGSHTAPAQPLHSSLALPRACVSQSREGESCPACSTSSGTWPWLPANTELLTGNIPTKPLLSPPEWVTSLAALFAQGGTVCSVAFLRFSFIININHKLIIFPFTWVLISRLAKFASWNVSGDSQSNSWVRAFRNASVLPKMSRPLSYLLFTW